MENQGIFKFLILSFQSSDFLDTQPCVQLRVIVPNIYPFVYQYIDLFYEVILKRVLFCYETKNLDGENKVKVLRYPISAH